MIICSVRAKNVKKLSNEDGKKSHNLFRTRNYYKRDFREFPIRNVLYTQDRPRRCVSSSSSPIIAPPPLKFAARPPTFFFLHLDDDDDDGDSFSRFPPCTRISPFSLSLSLSLFPGPLFPLLFLSVRCFRTGAACSARRELSLSVLCLLRWCEIG